VIKPPASREDLLAWLYRRYDGALELHQVVGLSFAQLVATEYTFGMVSSAGVSSVNRDELGGSAGVNPQEGADEGASVSA
jgi:hypothetical protein